MVVSMGPVGDAHEMHPAKYALHHVDITHPGLVQGCVDCPTLDCPGGRCIEMCDRVKSLVAQHLGVQAVHCFGDKCPRPQDPCEGQACIGKKIDL